MMKHLGHRVLKYFPRVIQTVSNESGLRPQAPESLLKPTTTSWALAAISSDFGSQPMSTQWPVFTHHLPLPSSPKTDCTLVEAADPLAADLLLPSL